jgi:hypothetical protein
MDSKIVMAISELSRLEGELIGIAGSVNLAYYCEPSVVKQMLGDAAKQVRIAKNLLMESQNESTTLGS